jgi:hypothetical protein
MAIDTRSKRSSAVNVGSPWRSLYPAPDGTVAQADRQQIALLYSGILAAAPVIVVTPALRHWTITSVTDAYAAVTAVTDTHEAVISVTVLYAAIVPVQT